MKTIFLLLLISSLSSQPCKTFVIDGVYVNEADFRSVQSAVNSLSSNIRIKQMLDNIANNLPPYEKQSIGNHVYLRKIKRDIPFLDDIRTRHMIKYCLKYYEEGVLDFDVL